MSTRSFIIQAPQEEGQPYRGIYCHFDGYPEGVGEKLVEHYAAANRVNALLDLGDLSSLGSELGEQHDFNDTYAQKRANGTANWCVAYHRDRGEPWEQVKPYEGTLEEVVLMGVRSSAEWLYLWGRKTGRTAGLMTWYVQHYVAFEKAGAIQYDENYSYFLTGEPLPEWLNLEGLLKARAQENAALEASGA